MRPFLWTNIISLAQGLIVRFYRLLDVKGLDVFRIIIYVYYLHLCASINLHLYVCMKLNFANYIIINRNTDDNVCY